MNQPDVVRPNEAVKSKGAGGIFSRGGDTKKAVTVG